MGPSEVPVHLAQQMKRVFGPGHAGHWDFGGPGIGVADGDGGGERVDTVNGVEVTHEHLHNATRRGERF